MTELEVGRHCLDKAHCAIEDLKTLMEKPEGFQFVLERKRDMDDLIANLMDMRSELEFGWGRDE